MIEQLKHGIRRNFLKFIISVPIAFAALWGIVEAFTSIYPNLNRPILLALLAIGALLIGSIRIWSPNQVSIQWKALNLNVTIKTGDLFSQNGSIAIAADDFFLIQDPKLVNTNSLIGQLLIKEYDNQINLLDNDIKQNLPTDAPHTLEKSEIPGKEIRYPVGTTVVIHQPKKLIYITALCKIDFSNNRGSATPNDVWIALQGLWSKVAANPKRSTISVPLLGAGQTGAGLSYSTALNLTLVSLIASTREKPISDHIQIIIPKQSLEKIDLKVVKENWKLS